VDVILQVFLIFVAAKAAAEVFIRLDLPPIAGELLVGIALGPHVAGVIEVSEGTKTLAQLGIVILLFTVGLETPLSGLMGVGRTAVVTSLGGIVAAFGAGTLVVWAFGYALSAAALAGTALAASSVGVAARVFQDLGVVRTPPARVVLGAAVVDDVVVLALFPLVLGLGGGGADVPEIVIGAVGAIAFIAFVALVGTGLARRHARLLELPRIRRSPFVLALAICLGLAALAERVGLAALVGAFLAGMLLAESRERFELDRLMQPLNDLLVPFFFVVTGASMDPSRLRAGNLGLAVAVVVTALAAKALGAGTGALGLDRRERLRVAAGMTPRTEVTLVVATAGLAGHNINADIFAVLVATVVVSTLVAGPALRWVVPAPAVEEGQDRSSPGGSPGDEGPEEAAPP
jgi:Kef-type K+ transport system membrane component KefB